MEGNQNETNRVQSLEILAAKDAVAECDKLEKAFRNKGDYCHNNIGSKTTEDWERMDKFLVASAEEIRRVRNCVQLLITEFSRKPLRNCDVGTAEEQFKRYHKFCMGGHGCSKCRVGISSGAGCSLAWAQMPYERESAEMSENESERRKTVADIVAEIRMAAKTAYEGQRGWPECWKGQIQPDTAEEWADCIEAICKREKAAIEADALAVGARVAKQERDELIYAYDPTKAEKGRAPDGSAYALEAFKRELSKRRPELGGEFGQFGNAAAMREALKNLADTVSSYIRLNLVQLPIPLDEALRKSRAALAAPPRNCDVGTAEEQLDRYGEYCQRTCTVCEYRHSCHIRGETRRMKCMFDWAQRPYEAKEDTRE